MRTRPRTPYVKRLRERRCQKCGKLQPTHAKRCKTCHVILVKVRP